MAASKSLNPSPSDGAFLAQRSREPLECDAPSVPLLLQEPTAWERTVPTRIVVADDHTMMRDGLRRMLNEEPDFQVVGEAADGHSAVRLTREMAPEVVVMDVRMPDLNGVEATRQITSVHPSVKVICLSAQADERTAAEVLGAGAVGYVVKESAFDELAGAIRSVVRGTVYLSPVVAGLVVGGYLKVRAAGSGLPVPKALSGREREVLQLVAEGKSIKEVAAHLHLSVKTVETHRRNLMEKLQLNSVAELTKYAVREGITSL